MIKHEIEDYKNFGKCVKFERNGIVLRVTLDIGPRVIYYGTENKNFFKEDIDRDVDLKGDYFDTNFKKGECWYLYGGHRLWKSPEDLETYTPDNYPVDYILTDDGGSFTTHVAKNFDYTMLLQLKDDGKVEVVDKIINKSEETREIAVWGLTVMHKGGVAIYKKQKAESDFLPQQNLVYWSYNDLNDDRMHDTHKFGCLKQTDKPEAIKIGTKSNIGKVAYVLGGDAFKVEFDVKDGNYTDYGCNLELYTNQHILEVEVLSPIEKLLPGGSIELVMNWSISRNVKLPDLTDETIEKTGLF